MALSIPACRSLLAAALLAMAFGTARSADTPADWPEIASDARPWAYWWWHASAVDRENLTRELARYREAGMGGVHIIPIYGTQGCDDRAIEYLSPQWMDMLAHVLAEGKRLGLGVDMTTGTGWCFGGPTISPAQAGQQAKIESLALDEAGRVASLGDRAWLAALTACSPQGETVDLLPRTDSSGRVDWQAPGTGWQVWALWSRPSGQKVKRAAPGGEGFMLNPFGRQPMEHYLTRFSEAFDARPDLRPRAMYHDSFEYQVNWSPELFEAFARRRGYSLASELPALAGRGDADRVARVKADYRETVSDLLVEEFLPPWSDWCRQRGILTRNQAHGSPGNLLDLYSAADIPETEMFHGDREILVSKFASSAAHVAGRQRVASETGTWLAEHFTETLGEMKLLVDELLASGVNHGVYHGTCYSPDDASWPGWLFYASTQMNPRNPIWRDAGALNAYIARCQAMLQSGQSDNDLLVYWPIHDLWHNADGLGMNLTVHSRGWLLEQPLGAAARQLWRRGYAFDYVSDRQVAGARAAGGQIELPGGRYRAVLVPPCTRMPVETLEHQLRLARRGATVVFADRLPSDVPGLHDLAARRQRLQAALAEMAWNDRGGGLREAALESGRLIVGPLEPALTLGGLARETLADREGMLFVRRTEPGGRIYFLANHGSQPVEDWLPLGTPCRWAAILDPMTGRTGAAAVRSANGAAEVFLQLAPGASLLVRTREEPPAKAAALPRWPYCVPEGEPRPLAGTWSIAFLEGGPVLPPARQLAALGSWTDLGGEAERFAGTARYTLTLDAPGTGNRFLLDLGRVAQSARVRLNGTDVATLLVPPFRTVLEGVKPQGNVLEVEVTGVAANRIRDLDRRKVAWRIFHDINLVNSNYRPFDASEWPLTPCGLLGPVTLQPVASRTP